MLRPCSASTIVRFASDRYAISLTTAACGRSGASARRTNSLIRSRSSLAVLVSVRQVVRGELAGAQVALEDQVLAVLHVVVHRGARQADALGDLVDRGCGDAARIELASGLVEQDFALRRPGGAASWRLRRGRGRRLYGRRRPAAVLVLSSARAPWPTCSPGPDIVGCNHNRTSNRLTSGFDRVLAPHTEVSNRRRCRGWTMRIFMGSLGLLAAAAAVAADNDTADTARVPTIGEIVVTAQRREESNLQVGLTLTALSADALAQQRVEQVLDLKGRVPNLDIKEQVPGAMPVDHDPRRRAQRLRRGQQPERRRLRRPGVRRFDRDDGVRHVRSRAHRSAEGTAGHAVRPQLDRRRAQHHHAQAAAELRGVHDARLRQLRHAGLRGRGQCAARRHGGAALQRQDDPAGRRLLGEPPAAGRDDRQSRPDDGAAAARARAGRQLRSESESRRHALALGDGPARILRHRRSADRRHLRADPRRPHRQHAVHGFPRLHRHRRRSVQGRLGARGRVRHRQHGRHVDDERAISAQRRSPAFPATSTSIARSTSTSMRRRRASWTSWRRTTSSSTRRSCGWPRAASGSTGSSARSTRRTKWA